MLEFEQMKSELTSYDDTMKEVLTSLDIEGKKNKIQEMEREMEAPDFWNDAEKATAKTTELKSLKDDVAVADSLQQKYEDIETFIEMDAEEDGDDEAMLEEAKEEFEEFKKDLENLRLKTLLSGKYDHNNAIVTLHAGAGGTEAMDWTQMLFRMYSKWADKHGFGLELLDEVEGDEAGLQSVTFQINGENAYGYLKSEKGVHRLVRISPFNANGKRQTSFSNADVMPELKDAPDIEIKDEDIRVDTYRSSGAGGQHINKTSSAIRITHFPTGIVVTCQNERSQHMNKDKAMEMLRAKLELLREQEQEQRDADIRGDVSSISWGNQIRSYVFQPYTMVKDLRTGEETSNVDGVMDGDLDPFMNSYLKWVSLGKPKRGVVDAD
ncbi:MAG: peptide chain release factor 2 [Lachnospiraceae bacterium]|nr:peptide chain release factor 2 [Lachnospiraceae bacterium]MDD7665315.1 peptide chain release factor 2 [Lachnospiraceae bacterium]MDY4164109.1 peptide chain release factor 2 [Lachnospiraceae bacterium]